MQNALPTSKDFNIRLISGKAMTSYWIFSEVTRMVKGWNKHGHNVPWLACTVHWELSHVTYDWPLSLSLSLFLSPTLPLFLVPPLPASLLPHIAGLPFLIIETSAVQPYRRGFYCNDESIKYPAKRGDTISDAVLCAAGILITILSVSHLTNITSPDHFLTFQQCVSPICITTTTCVSTNVVSEYIVLFNNHMRGRWKVSMVRTFPLNCR